MRYIVYAFYPNLGLKVRSTTYGRKSEMYDYIGGLRMCDTPYIAFDMKANKVLEKEVYQLGGEKMAEMLERYWDEQTM